MILSLLAAALAMLVTGAVASAAWRSGLRALRFGSVVGALACSFGALASAARLRHRVERAVHIAWAAPIRERSFGVDPLSAFFLLCIFVVGGLAVVYAGGYFAEAAGERPVGSAMAWLHVLVASMAAVVLARDVIVFLVAWEAMFIASYFLVTFDAHKEEVRRAGFTYLVASHISVVLILVLLGLLVRETGSRRFSALAAAPPPPASLANLCFALALAGFGIKAGLWPLHGWLPEAHPAAPSPVSALMSGVMIKMGIYGVLRSLMFLGPPPVSWGVVLLGMGGLSALAGVLLALAQHDLKRLLAYHSVENVGIIVLGIGVGLLGRAAHAPEVSILGFAGALLHTLNHGLFKGLLFQAVGAIVHATGSRDIERQGGLLRRMPTTGAFFLVGAIAISGLPPLNGFVSEWLVYLAAFRQGVTPNAPGISSSVLLSIPVLALIGGLAAACFVKVFGIVFLGEPRTSESTQAHEVGGSMRAAMALGAAACVGIGVFPAAAVRFVIGPAAVLAGSVGATFGPDVTPLPMLSAVAALLAATTIVLVLLRRYWLLRQEVTHSVTWDCGYAVPTPRMQYTAASFAAPALDPFTGLLHVRTHRDSPQGFFPAHAVEDVHFEDPGEVAIRWSLAAVVTQLTRVRMLQSGPVQLYLLYVFLTLLLLLVWQVRS